MILYVSTTSAVKITVIQIKTRMGYCHPHNMTDVITYLSMQGGGGTNNETRKIDLSSPLETLLPTRFTLIPVWISNNMSGNCGMKLLIYG